MRITFIASDAKKGPSEQFVGVHLLQEGSVVAHENFVSSHSMAVSREIKVHRSHCFLCYFRAQRSIQLPAVYHQLHRANERLSREDKEVKERRGMGISAQKYPTGFSVAYRPQKYPLCVESLH